jgi:putative PIN family toxin of toxin-antitoxin system
MRLLLDGAFELLVSPSLIAELERVLQRDKFRDSFSERQAAAFVGLLHEHGLAVDDPPEVEPLTPDPADDYLVALARSSGADFLISGDKHLTELEDPPVPVLTPRALLERLS